MFQTKVVGKSKHNLCSVTFVFSSIMPSLWDNVESYCRTEQATYGTCALDAGHLRPQTRTQVT